MITKVEDDPLRLSGLRQALYIAKCLQNGNTEHEIVEQFSGDEQLVKMWVLFLTYNQWAQPILDDENRQKWIFTDKGKIWLETIEDKFSNETS